MNELKLLAYFTFCFGVLLSTKITIDYTFIHALPIMIGMFGIGIVLLYASPSNITIKERLKGTK